MPKDDLDLYLEERLKREPELVEGLEEGYQDFKLGVRLQLAREAAGLSREEAAIKVGTNKASITRIEHNSGDSRVSTLQKYAKAVGKNLRIEIS